MLVNTPFVVEMYDNWTANDEDRHSNEDRTNHWMCLP